MPTKTSPPPDPDARETAERVGTSEIPADSNGPKLLPKRGPGAAVNAVEEPYLLLPEGLDLTSMKSKRFGQTRIQTFVTSGCLTPVLGSEMTAASVVPHQTITRDQLFRSQFDTDRELRHFHDALMRERSAERVLTPDSRPEAERCLQADEAIASLRLALLRAAFRATSLYAELWRGNVAPLHSWNAHAMVVDAPEAVLARTELVDRLTDAVNAIRDFVAAQPPAQEMRDHRTALLGGEGLRTRLEHLSDVLLRPEARLSGTTVEWLTDVLWHVLIFDSPCYPTREELALQVSLADDVKSPIQKVELTALTSGGIDQDWERYGYAMSRTLSGLRGGSAPVPEVGALHRELAASLNLSYHRWREERGSSDALSPLPLAITLTTDLEMERSLATDAHGSGFYHVAFPMILTNVNHNSRGHVRWVVGKFRAGLTSGPELWSQLTHPVGQWELLNDVAEGIRLAAFSRLAPVLQGPLLLKANGSPLHFVAEPLVDNQKIADGFVAEILSDSQRRQNGRRRGLARHVPTTTELEILQLTQVDQWAMGATNGKAGLHEAIRSSFNEHTRGWLILGHDLSEWSSRLQLFTQITLSSLVQPTRETDSITGKVHDWTMAVVAKADEQRARLLLGLDIPLSDHTELSPVLVADSIRNGLNKVGWGR